MSNTKHVTIQRVCLSGLSHHEYAQNVFDLVPGVQMDLIADPTNKFDPHAVKVMLGDSQIGWIPKGKNETLAILLKNNFDVRGWIISHDTKADLQSRLYISVTLAKAGETK